jgi:hypothetical protein
MLEEVVSQWIDFHAQNGYRRSMIFYPDLPPKTLRKAAVPSES